MVACVPAFQSLIELRCGMPINDNVIVMLLIELRCGMQINDSVIVMLFRRCLMIMMMMMMVYICLSKRTPLLIPDWL